MQEIIDEQGKLLNLGHMNQQKTNSPIVVGTVSSRANWEEMYFSAGECDWLEWRVDMLLEEVGRETLLSEARPELPVLLTVRAGDEGGSGGLGMEERRELYAGLLPVATAIDVEIAHMDSLVDIVEDARSKGILVVGSAHHFKNSFSEEEIREKDAQARGMGADIVKIAHFLQEPGDLLLGTEWLRHCRNEGLSAALMGMGPMGPVSRLLYAQMGSRLVYGYLGEHPTAPGQLPASEFRRVIAQLSPLS